MMLKSQKVRKVLKKNEKNICTECSSLVKIDGDELEISTDYLDTNFTSKLEINDN